MKSRPKKQALKTNWLFPIIVLVLLMFTIVGIKSVYAALTAEDDLTNDFTMSNLSGKIEEEFTPPSKENPMKPGKDYPKEVKINNQTKTPMFVRVLVTPEIQTATGVLLPSNFGKELIINLGSKWLLGEDGYYYYLGKLASTQTTEALFTKVTLSDDVSDSYNDAEMSIHIKSETIIAKGNQYRDAWWLGETPIETNLSKIDILLQTEIK